MPAFYQGLSEQGYVGKQNFEIVFERSDFQFDRLPALASDLVRRQATVIVATTTFAAQAVKQATNAIPIVFTVGTDPVQTGLVASSQSPGR